MEHGAHSPPPAQATSTCPRPRRPSRRRTHRRAHEAPVRRAPEPRARIAHGERKLRRNPAASSLGPARPCDRTAAPHAYGAQTRRSTPARAHTPTRRQRPARSTPADQPSRSKALPDNMRPPTVPAAMPISSAATPAFQLMPITARAHESTNGRTSRQVWAQNSRQPRTPCRRNICSSGLFAGQALDQ